jgi:hypothetical protein
MAVMVRIEDTGIPYGVRSIIEQLPLPENVSPGDEIILKFKDEFVFLTGLVLLAAWRKHLPQGVMVRADDSVCSLVTQRFLTNTGFREIIDTGHESPSVQKRIGRIPLQPITNRFSKEATVNEITNIFEEYAGQVRDTNPFKTLLSELCENVLAHSEFTSPGYVCARVLETAEKEKAEITIADTGIGIRESFLRGTNENAKERIAKGAGAIEIAIDGLNSSKPVAPSGTLRSYYGFGLLVTRRLVEENRGFLTIVSGREVLTIDPYRREQSTLAKPWNGTFVGIVLDLTNPLPLDEIYEEAAGKLVPSAKGQPPGVTPVTVSLTETQTTKDGTEPLQERRIELRHYGSELLTRDAGTAIRADLASYLAGGARINILLEGITDITPSVADEAFGKLAEIMGFEEFQSKVALEGGAPVVRRLIDFVLKTRSRSLS